MSKKQADQVRGLQDDVMEDADTRSSMSGGGMTAGHDGKHFFLSDSNNKFRMNIEGQLQVRYLYNHRNDDPATFDDPGTPDEIEGEIDRDLSGFQIRRAKLGFNGYVASPKFEYDFLLAANRAVNAVFLEKATIGYQISDQSKLVFGRDKLPFLREELTSSKRQLAVDRAAATEVFTLNYSEGIWLKQKFGDSVKGAFAFSDGANAANEGGGAIGSNDFTDSAADFALTGRVDTKLAGDWYQMKDFAAWEGEPFAAFAGAAVHYQQGESGVPQTKIPNYLTWTIDGSIESNGINVYTAAMGGHVDNRGISPDKDNYGFLLQSGWMIVPDKVEPFARLEYIDMDGASYNRLATIGVNRYFNKHNAKFTMDLVYSFDTLTSALKNEPFGASGVSSGIGLLKDDGDADGQFAFRSQFQLLF